MKIEKVLTFEELQEFVQRMADNGFIVYPVSVDKIETTQQMPTLTCTFEYSSDDITIKPRQQKAFEFPIEQVSTGVNQLDINANFNIVNEVEPKHHPKVLEILRQWTAAIKKD